MTEPDFSLDGLSMWFIILYLASTGFSSQGSIAEVSLGYGSGFSHKLAQNQALTLLTLSVNLQDCVLKRM